MNGVAVIIMSCLSHDFVIFMHVFRPVFKVSHLNIYILTLKHLVQTNSDIELTFKKSYVRPLATSSLVWPLGGLKSSPAPFAKRLVRSTCRKSNTETAY